MRRILRYFGFGDDRPFGPALMLVYMRALSVYLILTGIDAWSILIGGHGGDTFFGDLPLQWQVVNIYFAILSPIAAIGMWFGAGWGVASWLFVAVTEVVMHALFPDLFGHRWDVVGFHAFSIVLYVLFARWAGAPENTTTRFSVAED